MNSDIYVPDSLQAAGRELRAAFATSLSDLPKRSFVRAWCALAYLFPSLHPDDYQDPASSWPRALTRFAAEAWRRADAGQISEDELYPSDSQWAGLYDRMANHLPDETSRRMELSAAFDR